MCWGEGGPSTAPGNARPSPGTRPLHLEGAPLSSLMVLEAESRGSPSAPGGGGISAGGGGSRSTSSSPAGAPASPGRGHRWGWGPRAAPPPPGPALGLQRPLPPTPGLRPPIRRGPTPSPPPQAPPLGLTLSRRVWPRRENPGPRPEAGCGRASREPGKGEERRDREEEALEESAGYRGRPPRGEGGLRAEARTEEGRMSPPSQFRVPASPVAWSVPEPRCHGGEALVRGGRGGPGVLP